MKRHPMHHRIIYWLALLTGVLLCLLVDRPVSAASFTYEDATSQALDETLTELCMAPLVVTFDVGDSFTINDLNVGFNATHTYRSDMRLVLQSPQGTRAEILTEFFALPSNYFNYVEDQNENYDILLDSDSSNPIDSGSNDDPAAPYYDRVVGSTGSLAVFNGEEAQGIWRLEICDAGILDSGTYNRSQLEFDGAPSTTGIVPDTISGRLFRDYNGDGAINGTEAGIAAITVSAYDDSGNMVDQSSSDDLGVYTLAVPDNTAVRLEVTGQPAYLEPGVFGDDSATTVTFVTSPAAGINMAFNNPGEHCQAAADTKLAVSCFRYGPNDGAFTADPTILSFAETDGSFEEIVGNALGSYPANSAPEAAQSETGATWGLAYDPLHEQLLAASLVKRHTGLGATGNPTTIYVIDPNTPAGATAWSTLDNARADPHNNPAQWYEDFAVFDFVGKEGWGDIDIAEDFSTVYGVDLGTRSLVAIPMQTDGTAGVATSIDILANLPAGLVGNGANQCPTTDDLRPFGLGVHDGVVYVGAVCSAQSTVPANSFPIQPPFKSPNAPGDAKPGDPTKLRAYVFAWNGDLAAPSFTTALNFPLNYDRGCVTYNHVDNCELQYDAHWAPWIGDFPYSSFGGGQEFESMYPQPLLSDLEFDHDNIVLFMMDRFGHQVGGYAASPYGEFIYDVAQASDILYACAAGGGWVMEELISGDASCATPGLSFVRGDAENGEADRIDEYFSEDTFRARYNLHDDVGMGAGVMIPGRDSVIGTVFDPVYRSDARVTIFNGGLHWYTTDDGHWRRAVQLYEGSGNLLTDGVFSKAGGLGDVTAFCDLAPIEIGNRVWADENRNGIQDPAEPPIAGVIVELYQGAALIDTATTDSDGHYIFSSALMTSTAALRYGLNLQINTAYEVRIPNAEGPSQQAALATLQLTETDDATPSPSGSDMNDSDGALVNNAASVNLTTGGVGANNHTYDFGFAALLSLGNRVWIDDGSGGGGADNGVMDGGEVGVAGVSLRLLDGAGLPILDSMSQPSTTTTDGNGHYLFDNLTEGDYIVCVAATNFAGGGPLAGLLSSTPTEADPDADVDSNDNGINDAALAMNGICSGVVTLSLTQEPVGETDLGALGSGSALNANSNLTVDFGFFAQPTLYSLGNQVWFDDDNDAQRQSGEVLIPNVALTLYDTHATPADVSDDTVVSQTVTVANGLYLFPNLPTGDYYVMVDAGNFAVGAPLAGCVTSNEALDEDDPNADGDNNDNGMDTAQGIRSGVVTLAGGEPTGENPSNDAVTPDANANLTVDFGFTCTPTGFDDGDEPALAANQLIFLPFVTAH